MSEFSRVLIAIDAIEKKLSAIYVRLSLIEERVAVAKDEHNFYRNSLALVLTAVASAAVTHWLH